MSDAVSHALDLTAVHPREAMVVPSAGRADRQQTASLPTPGDTPPEVLRLRAALEDIVALAHSSATASQRVVQMQRRAIATLTGLDQRR